MLLDIILPSVVSDITNQTEAAGTMLDSIAGATAAAITTTTTTTTTGHQMPSQLPCSKDLIAVLIECFTIIWLGYMSGRFKLISTDAKDLGAYLTTFALPMVIFLNIAQMEISSINLSFLFCMLISKLILFILVTLITLVISYPANFSYSGALSILSTQSNDFALGYPLFKSLYGATRPAMLDYLNLMGPIQLLIINPLGIAMLEFEKSRTKRRLAAALVSCVERKKCSHCLSSSSSSSTSPGDDDDDDDDDDDNHQLSRSPSRQMHIIEQTKAVHEEQHQQIIIKPSQPPLPLNTNSIQNPHYQQQQQAVLSSSLINLVENRRNSSVDVDEVYIDNYGAQSEVNNNNNNNLFACEKENNGEGMATSLPTGLKRKNIKSLVLVMPAVIMPSSRSSSHQSVASSTISSTRVELRSTVGATNCIDKQLILQSGTISSAESLASLHGNQQTIASRRSVYTRPKMFNSLVSNSSKLFAASRRGGGASQQQVNSSSSSGSDLININNKRNSNTDSRNCTCVPYDQLLPNCAIDLSFVTALLTNPLIIASLVALAVNLVHGPELPKFVTKVSNTLAASFAAPALFVVGLSMYGKFSLILKNPNDFLLASVLAITKVMILPCIMRTTMLLLLPHHVPAAEVPYMADFSYLYGLLPAAPGACIIAKQYEVLTNVVSITMLLSTLISAPLMLATAAVIDQAASIKPETTLELIEQTMRASSGVTLVLSLLTLYLLWRSSRRVSYRNFSINSLEFLCLDNVTRAKATHLFTLLLTMTQLVVGLGGLMWLFVDMANISPAPAPLRADSDATNLMDDYLDAGETRNSMLAIHKDQPNQENLIGRYLTAGANAILQQQQQQQMYGFGALCTMQFILSSGAILMARFIVLCIVLTNFAERTSNRRFKPLVGSLMMKVYPLVGVAIIISLAFESQHLSCSPSESSLPTWPVSIYLRLVFNITLLCLAIPMLTATFRLDNKTSWRRLNTQANSVTAANTTTAAAAAINATTSTTANTSTVLRHERRFVTSSASLTSETSSAITTSTNLDATFGGGGGHRNSRRTSASARPALDRLAGNQSTSNLLAGVSRLTNSMTTLADCAPRELTDINHQQRGTEQTASLDDGVNSLSHHRDDQSNNSSTSTNTSAPSTKKTHRYDLSSIQSDGVPVVDRDVKLSDVAPPGVGHLNLDLNESSFLARRNTPPAHYQQSTQWSTSNSNSNSSTEFDKYSILIVFTLFQALLSVASMIQQLSQDKPFGTFLLIELSNVALDFGQGLVTFLVIGLQVISLQDFLCARPLARTRRQRSPVGAQQQRDVI